MWLYIFLFSNRLSFLLKFNLMINGELIGGGSKRAVTLDGLGSYRSQLPIHEPQNKTALLPRSSTIYCFPIIIGAKWEWRKFHLARTCRLSFTDRLRVCPCRLQWFFWWMNAGVDVSRKTRFTPSGSIHIWYNATKLSRGSSGNALCIATTGNVFLPDR